MDNTPRLGLNKPNPDPVTGDFVDVTKLNENFDKIDSAINTTVCTAATRPATPFNGQVILETDTGRMYVRLASAWVQLMVSGATFLSTIESQRTASTDLVLRHKLSGDSQYRLQINGAGRIDFGDGSTAADTNLYRSAANELKTDDAFVVTQGLTVQGNPTITNKTGLNGTLLATGTTGSTSYANLPAKAAGGAASFSFTKKRSDTRLRVAMKLIAYSDATSTGMQLGCQIGATDYDVTRCYYTSAIYLNANGWTYISGLAAGTYTLQGRWKRFAGSGNLGTFNTISELDFEAEEMN